MNDKTQSESMRGKRCLITGTTGGIGAAAARELAQRGASITIVGRNAAKADQVIAAIRRERPGAEVEFLQADLSLQRENRRLADEVRRRCARVDVLINNVGAMYALRRESEERMEMTLALNHIGPFLLTTLLLDVLKRSGPARIVNVSSEAHRDVKGFDFDDPEAREGKRARRYGTSELKSLGYSVLVPWKHPGFEQYAMSKLANLLFTRELARRLAGSGVTVNALHPGFVRSEFMAGNGSLGWFLRLWSSLFGITPEEGAGTVVYLASSPEVAGVSGKYFVKERETEPTKAAQDDAAARRLWEMSEAWCNDRQRAANGMA